LDNNYEELVSIVEDVEKNSQKVEFSSIDISTIQDLKVQRQMPQFKMLLALAMSIESSHTKGAVRQQQSRPQPTAIPKPVVKQPVQKLSSNQALKTEVGTFADKLSKNADTPKKINKFSPKAEGKDEPVLEKLSIHDQIAELERMIEGINNGSFDYGQMETIRKEVYELNRYSIQEIMKGGKKKTDKLQQDLIMVREQRLNDVMKLLSDKG
jgi:hypothetical protein